MRDAGGCLDCDLLVLTRDAGGWIAFDLLVLTWDAGGWIDCWRPKSYFEDEVRMS